MNRPISRKMFCERASARRRTATDHAERVAYSIRMKRIEPMVMVRKKQQAVR
ncbi:MAG: hypothetical protein FWD53_06770 [Phycisphaerales bacterium]|nr:hypothetical protein [Phycisphaerales bacterium]